MNAHIVVAIMSDKYGKPCSLALYGINSWQQQVFFPIYPPE